MPFWLSFAPSCSCSVQPRQEVKSADTALLDLRFEYVVPSLLSMASRAYLYEAFGSEGDTLHSGHESSTYCSGQLAPPAFAISNRFRDKETETAMMMTK